MPSKAPTNATAVNDTDIRLLPLLWEPLPQKFVHGVLLGYKVTYQAIQRGDIDETGLPVWKLIVGPNDTSVVLQNLESYTVYRVQIWAFTRIGDGPRTTFNGGKTAEVCIWERWKNIESLSVIYI